MNKKRKQIYYKVIIMSHPELRTFKETLEKELENPSGDYAFGDIAWGMTPKELCSTKIFNELSIEENRIKIDYLRISYLRECFGGPDFPWLKFGFKNNGLEHVFFFTDERSTPKYDYSDRETLVNAFISRCKKLSNYYGNPKIIRDRLFPDHEGLTPLDSNIFYGADFYVKGEKYICMYKKQQ